MATTHSTDRSLRSLLADRVLQPLRRTPTAADLPWILLIVPYGLVALVLALTGGIVEPSWPDYWEYLLVPPALLVFPSLLEESIFRGLLLPPDLSEASPQRQLAAVLTSTAVFVAWHPLNHFLIGISDTSVFVDPTFLVIVTLLGLTCALQYLKTRSLWLPVLTHWATVLIWNLFLGRDFTAG